MLKPGDTIENPVSGEYAVIRATARETGGALCALDMTVRPRGGVFVAHVHPSQEERFEVVDGTIEVEIDGARTMASAGDSVVIAPGQVHSWWNAGEEDARFTIEVRPALRFDAFLDETFAVARAGKTTRGGRIRLLPWAPVGKRYRAEFRIAAPAALYDTYLALAAPLARLLRVAPA
jgi:quercetin dioxygenase-like cupin family protein